MTEKLKLSPETLEAGNVVVNNDWTKKSEDIKYSYFLRDFFPS